VSGEVHHVCEHEVLLGTRCEKCELENPTYEICEHHVLLHEECELCKDDMPKLTAQQVSDASVALGNDMKHAMADVIRSVQMCEGLHPSATMKYLGPLELYICDDPQCAHIIAKCTHQVEIPEDEDTVPRKFVKSICEWNADGTILTCTFCGKDGT